MMNFVQGKVKNLKIKHILLCVFAFFMISSLAFLVTKNLKQIHAYDFSSFNPGNIISDGVMANYEPDDGALAQCKALGEALA